MKIETQKLNTDHPTVILPHTHEGVSVEKISNGFLKNLKGKKVLLYVSSSESFEHYLDLPFDYVVLTNYEYFRESRLLGNKIIEMPHENSKSLRLLHEAGVKISCFVGIQDGCCEGGNFECVNSPSFFGRLSPVLADKAVYITNHWDFNSRHFDFFNSHYEKVGWTPDFPLIDASLRFAFHPSDETGKRIIAIQRKNADTIEQKVGNILIKVSNGSVWDKRAEFDCIIHPEYASYSAGYYDGKRDFSPFVKYKLNIEEILSDANSEKWATMGMIPFMKGRYREFLKLCRQWKEPYPQTIHFFHLKENDLTELKNELKNPEP